MLIFIFILLSIDLLNFYSLFLAGGFALVLSTTIPRIISDRMEFSSDMMIIALSNPGELILPVCPKVPLVTYATTPSPVLVTTSYQVPELPVFPPPDHVQGCINPEDLSCPICGAQSDIVAEVYCQSSKGR